MASKTAHEDEKGAIAGEATFDLNNDPNANVDINVGPPSAATSEEDYDNLSSSPSAMVTRQRKHKPVHDTPPLKVTTSPSSKPSNGIIITAPDDPAIRDAVRHSRQRLSSHPNGATPDHQKRRPSRPKFTDLVFTRKFSAFDRQNHEAANSPFHGFFTLFWMAVFFFVVKIGVDNWRNYGNVLGRNEIMKGMFRRDVVVLLVADGVMCGEYFAHW
jgi:sterol O-acyltransferase